jgi:hypothetical protein
MNNALFIDKEPHTKLNKNFPLELRAKTIPLKNRYSRSFLVGGFFGLII